MITRQDWFERTLYWPPVTRPLVRLVGLALPVRPPAARLLSELSLWWLTPEETAVLRGEDPAAAMAIAAKAVACRDLSPAETALIDQLVAVLRRDQTPPQPTENAA
jgi:hypothetical protein